uniref:Uncharacterized protein n=1 Tax=Desertifilum tharense IPPAS B-1220 TaxID=1781255 RepID=A0ACD5H2Z5_9CYAN
MLAGIVASLEHYLTSKRDRTSDGRNVLTFGFPVASDFSTL